MPTMSQEEWRVFVTAGTRTGKLATTRADGGPHVAPVWFVLDGDDLVFMPPHAFVQITGTVSARSMGIDRAEEFTRRNAVRGALLARLTPSRVIAEHDIAG